MFRIVMVSGLVFAALSMLPASAATTCSARHKTCLDFCAKNQRGSASSCTTQCAEALPQCMSSGCWVTRMANQCGLTKS